MNTLTPHKIFWNDVETTGTDPKIHGILQIAFILADAEGNEVTEYSSFCHPLKDDKVDPKALEITGITLEQMASFPSPYTVYHAVRTILDKHGHKGMKSLRFIPAGYNNQFDLEFLMAWMTKIDSKFAFWDFLQMTGIDVMPVCRAFRHAEIFKIPNTKLGTVCDLFKIPLKAHDALADIRATKELTEKIYGQIFQQWTGKPYGLLGEKS
jgi:exonuclease I